MDWMDRLAYEEGAGELNRMDGYAVLHRRHDNGERFPLEYDYAAPQKTKEMSEFA